ncbi:PAT family beta-lactamase induction signal transducer AmpG [Methylopila capsulata]|uniref:MFS transporter n=1 Tax=Methylopila capsulata TaxID=61654 RepID=A0A9W6IUD8_9HYPH|nr:MFS transporter [Methylopila capsulata]MBM7850512.1 PAT family beta-lactamase induction signal transducer AmpG [Methylopila capsulata]GLK55807.1 MFS transporter [Methylopila capsulata]
MPNPPPAVPAPSRSAGFGLKRFSSGVLGYASGLPLLLVGSTFAFWLRESGVSVQVIGLLSWASIAYSLKFLIAPAMDAYSLGPLGRALGRRRAWIFAAQVCVAAGLAAMAFGDPAANLALAAVGCFATAAASATQDAAVDGWRVEAAGPDEQGLLVAAYQLGYRMAMLTAGAGALYLATGFGWIGAYGGMAAVMALVACLTLTIIPSTDRDAARPEPTSAGSALAAPLRDLVALVAATPLTTLALIGLYRVPDQLANVMSSPLYKDLGFTNPEIANVTKIFGVILGIAGAFLGGFLLKSFSVRTVLIVGIVASAATNLFYTALSASGHSMAMLTATISFDNVASAVAGTALIAFMSKLAASEFSATRYAVLSSIYALPGHLLAGGSGFGVAALGYGPYFVITFLTGLPALLLCLWLPRESRAPRTAAADAAS